MKERKDVHCDVVIHYNNTVLEMKNCVVLGESDENIVSMIIKDAKTGVDVNIILTNII